MDEQDLELCGFRSEQFAAALQACGLANWNGDGPRWPVALVVNYSGSLDRERADIPPQVVQRRPHDQEAFTLLLTTLNFHQEKD